MDKQFGIHFGALAPKIEDQITSQGLKYDKEKVASFELFKDSLLTLRFGDVIADGEYDKCIKRLYKLIELHVLDQNKLVKKKNQ